ncbi:MAG TPA: amidohydrolase family protein [Pyrinomonadaceae bacterium]|nr:amidohydrolase family protein [Pyrinomonadaceae bacterium]
MKNFHRSAYRVLLLGCFLLTSSLAAQDTVIKAGHLFDSRTGKFVPNQTIIVRGGRIAEVGPNLSYKNTDTLIDLSKSWVLPGLMDCHVHITSNYPHRKYTGLHDIYTTESSGFRSLRGAFVSEQLLMGGFTTIKEIGNDGNYASADVIKAIRQGWVKGPTIFYSGKIIAPYGGQSQNINPENEHLWQFEYIDADTPDEVKKAVRKNIYYGANTIKMVSGDNATYDEADIRAAVDEAKKAGIKVTVHVMGGQGARNVIMGGAAAIEHGFDLDDDLLRLMKEKGTFLVGTDLYHENLHAYGMGEEQAKNISNGIADRLRRAYKVGTKMAFGTDVIIDLPGMNRLQSNFRVLENWKIAEIPPPYILQTMTIHAAELLGVEKNRGVIDKSYWADIVAVNADPSANIDAIKNVRFVMKAGRVVRNDRPQ